MGSTERREAILDSAARAFAVGGFAGTSMADVAAAAEVTHLIVYRHFASKEMLYAAVLDRSVERLATSVGGPGAVDRFGPTVASLLAAARADMAGFTVLWRHAAREAGFARWVDAARAVLHDSTRDALEPLVEDEILEWAVRAHVAYLLEAVLNWIEYGDRSLDDRFVAATRAALRAGIRKWTAS